MLYEDEPRTLQPDEQSELSEEERKKARREANEAAMRARRDERFGRSLKWDL